MGRDCFWTIPMLVEYVATLSSLQGEGAASSAFLKRSDCAPFSEQTRAILDSKTNAQLLKIAHNCKDPFGEWPVGSMLKSLGWSVIQRSSSGSCETGVEMFVPPWVAQVSGVDAHSSGQEGRDFFTNRGDQFMDFLVVRVVLTFLPSTAADVCKCFRRMEAS